MVSFDSVLFFSIWGYIFYNIYATLKVPEVVHMYDACIYTFQSNVNKYKKRYKIRKMRKLPLIIYQRQYQKKGMVFF